ncbi:MAG: AraC family transcriptional regulator [Bacteroidota bacterium]|nr:AraC family transcriptional regulator [Bacteroidota bacterium]
MNIHKTDGFEGEISTIIPSDIINRIHQMPLISDLYIFQIGYYPKAVNHFKERKSGANEYILKYCVSGAANYNIGDRQHRIEKDTYFIVPQNVPHKYWADKKDPWGVYWIHFKGKKAEEFYKLFQSIKQGGPVAIEYNASRTKKFEQIIETLLRGFSDENLMYANILLFEFLGSFLYAHKFDSIIQNHPKTLRDKLIHFMKNNIHRELSLNEFALEANYSVSHLCLVFKKDTGISVKEYFSHLKIQRACQYLTHTGMSIKEISQSLGYEDAMYFSRVFSKIMKTNPRAYRMHSKDILQN